MSTVHMPLTAFTNRMDDTVLKRWPHQRTAAGAAITPCTQPVLGFNSACSFSVFLWAEGRCGSVSPVIAVQSPNYSLISHAGQPVLGLHHNQTEKVISINHTTQALGPYINCQYTVQIMHSFPHPPLIICTQRQQVVLEPGFLRAKLGLQPELVIQTNRHETHDLPAFLLTATCRSR